MDFFSKIQSPHNTQLELLLCPPDCVVEGIEDSIAAQRELIGARGLGSEDDRFSFFALLISHTREEYVREGLCGMEQLLFFSLPTEGGNPQAEESKPDPRRLASYLLYTSVARCKLGDWDMAYSLARRLLDLEPDDRQGCALIAYIEHMQTREGVLGLAGLVGVSVTAGAGAAALAMLGAAFLRRGK